jgi:hypothetical protein
VTLAGSSLSRHWVDLPISVETAALIHVLFAWDNSNGDVVS